VHPFIVTPALEVIDGNRRLKGAQLAGDLDFLVDCIIREDANDPIKAARIQFDTAIHRADWSLHDKIAAVIFMRDNHKGLSGKQLAELLEIGETMVSKLLSFERCVPEVQEAVKAGKIGLRDMAHAATLPPDDQLVYLQTRLGGASVEQAHQESKKRRAGGNKPKTSSDGGKRVNIPLAVDTKDVTAKGCVTVAGLKGSVIDLDAAENLLKEALKAVREAQNRGWGLKAAQAAWRDIAKKAEKKPQGDMAAAG
jgi:ParB-like chromosome segregation protein Spo0J